jgi:hypothetical protein
VHRGQVLRVARGPYIQELLQIQTCIVARYSEWQGVHTDAGTDTDVKFNYTWLQLIGEETPSSLASAVPSLGWYRARS